MLLRGEEREFLKVFGRVIFTNPFAEDRSMVEQALSTLPSIRQATGHEPTEPYFQLMTPALNACIRGLDARGACNISLYRGEDRRLLAHAVIVYTLRRYLGDMDRHIQAQLGAGDTAMAVPFAAPLIQDLSERGLSQEESHRYLALLFQLRRAYFFTARALVGDSDSMKRLRLALWNCVFTRDVRTYDRYLWDRMEDFSTLLLGETGTGKGAAAAAIGRSGYIPFDPVRGRFADSFNTTYIAANLSQYPESLIESELFGHRKGAFTGAVEDYPGLFGRSGPHSTLFLDEIGELAAPVQIKLLRVLQEREYAAVGSHASKRFSGRVIAATNRALGELRDGGQFRDDFYYRLCANVIELPPLRERFRESPQERGQLVGLLVRRATGQDSPELAASILRALDRDLPADYAWPGNVRELEQAVRRVLINGRYQGDPWQHRDLSEYSLQQKLQEGRLTARALLAEYCALIYRRCGTYEEVARRSGLDRRTAKKYVDEHRQQQA